MNERIKELAEQADLVRILNEQAHAEGFVIRTFNNTPYPELEKFAELIVRECAELCSEHATMHGPFNEMEFRKGQHFYSIIKQHFGVED